jgi:hypothetical protein
VGFAVRLRKRLLIPFIALLGAAAAVLPALAASSEVKLEVNELQLPRLAVLDVVLGGQTAAGDRHDDRPGRRHHIRR